MHSDDLDHPYRVTKRALPVPAANIIKENLNRTPAKRIYRWGLHTGERPNSMFELAAPFRTATQRNFEESDALGLSNLKTTQEL